MSKNPEQNNKKATEPVVSISRKIIPVFVRATYLLLLCLIFFSIRYFLSSNTPIPTISTITSFTTSSITSFTFSSFTLSPYSLISSLSSLITSSTLSSSPLIRKTENPLKFTEGLTHFLYLNYINAYNFFLMVFPAELSAEYSFDCIHEISSVEDFRNILSVVFHIFLWGFLLYTILKRKPRLFYCFCWILLPYLPVSHLFITIGTLIAER